MDLTLEELIARTREWKRAGLLPNRPPKSRPRVHLPVYDPCPLEGDVLEACTMCGGDMKHVRKCGHQENTTGKCTRIFVSDRVWCCATCTKDPRKLTTPPTPVDNHA